MPGPVPTKFSRRRNFASRRREKISQEYKVVDILTLTLIPPMHTLFLYDSCLPKAKRSKYLRCAHISDVGASSSYTIAAWSQIKTLQSMMNAASL